ncbi:MAG: ATP-dependent Clp protease ATP-binding subunit ClpC, partial [Candidatus Dormibacteraeota bacterium]|nr:ATP-dependent Clp protease ATP-binding subunit ClpC [Candidatus Dormibacteraeota bacterium]
VRIKVTERARDRLGEEGFDRQCGARPLRRVITSRIEDALSEELLRGRFKKGDEVEIDADPEGGFTFNVRPQATDEEPAAALPQAPKGNAG